MRVIYVDVDSLRPDHTEPYGYARKITPNLGTKRTWPEGEAFLGCTVTG